MTMYSKKSEKDMAYKIIHLSYDNKTGFLRTMFSIAVVQNLWT